MITDSVFDKLVSELSTNDKKDMLDKLERSLTFSEVPLVEDAESDNFVNLETEYSALSFFEKIIIFLKMFFFRAERLKLTEEFVLKRHSRQLESRIPGYFDFLNQKAMGLFCKDLVTLRQAVSVFKNAVHGVLSNQAKKKEFYAYLGNVFFPLLESDIWSNTDPWALWRKDPNRSPESIKQEIDFNFDQAFNSFSTEEKRVVIQNTRSLDIMDNLSIFPFENIINYFPQLGEHTYGSCMLIDIKDSVQELFSILHSFIIPPKTATIRALFLFFMEENILDKNFDLESELYTRMNMAKEALNLIREFNAKYPLHDIAVALTGKIDYEFMPIGGGDDWFKLYREFWKERVQIRYREFSVEREKQQKVKDLAKLWKIRTIQRDVMYKEESYPEAPEVHYGFTAAAIGYFLNSIFPQKLHYSLNVVLIDGKFYKKDNRKEFDDIFNDLIKLPDTYNALFKQLKDGGDIYNKIINIRETITSQSLKVKSIQDVFLTFEKDLHVVLDRTLKLMNKMKNLVEGIVIGNGGAYDTLSNLSEIGGVNNKQLVRDLNDISSFLSRSMALLYDIYTLENRTTAQ